MNKYVDRYFEAIDPKDIEYGLLNGELRLKNIFFKNECLKNFGDFLLRDSKIEEIYIKYNWSLLGNTSIDIKLKNFELNIEDGQLEVEEISEKENIKLKNTNINIEITNIAIIYKNVQINILNLTCLTTEVLCRKKVRLEHINIKEFGKTILDIPCFEMELNLRDNENILVSVLIRRIHSKICLNGISRLQNYKDGFISGLRKESDSKMVFKVICNIHMVVIDLTDVKKRIQISTLSMSISNKFKIWIEKVVMKNLCRRKTFVIKQFNHERSLVAISKLSGDQTFCKIEKCLFDASHLIPVILYYKNSSKKGNTKTKNIVVVVSQLTILLDGIQLNMNNNKLEVASERIQFSSDGLCVDELLKIDFIKVCSQYNKIKSETGNILVNLDEANLLKFFRLYKRCCYGQEQLQIIFEQYITNLKVVYLTNETLFDIDELIIKYNSLQPSSKIPLLSINSDADYEFNIYRIRDKLICCLSDFVLDLKLLDKFNRNYLLGRVDEIRNIKNQIARDKKSDKSDFSIVVYNSNVIYEDLKMNIEFLEYNSISINLLFNLTLDDQKYVIVDDVHIKVKMDDILQVRIHDHARINVSNYIFNRLARFKNDIQDNIMMSILEEEESASICWILDCQSFSLNCFDEEFNEIAAFHLVDTKIGNLREYDGDETVRKLYFRIKDIQLDNQVLKSIYPVMVSKSNGDDVIECCIFYYYNSSTLFIKKTNVSFGEFSVNSEEIYLEKIVQIFKVEDKSDTRSEEVEGFMNTCVTIKDFEINELSLKINYIMKKGDDIKGRLMFFMMNNISDFNLVIERMVILHHRTSVKGLFTIIFEYYKSQIYNNMFKVLGHLDILGNVGGLSSTISGTIKENVKKKTGFFKGSRNLLRNTFCGVSSTLGKISKSVKNNAGLLTFDKEFLDSSEYHPYQQDIHLPLPIKKNDIKSLELIMKGTERLFHSVYSGLVGVAKKPIKGSEDGVSGIILGLGKGVIGAISKPVVGVSELLTNCTEIFSNSLRRDNMRVCYPLYTTGGIGKYNFEVSSAFYLFCAYLRNKKDEKFVDGTFGDFQEKAILLLTNKRLIISTETGVFDVDLLDVNVDSREKYSFTVESQDKTQSLRVNVNRKEFVESLCKLLM